MENDYDFAGWALYYDIKYPENDKILKKGACRESSGRKVPLVNSFINLNDPNNVIGHATLKDTDKGIYVYGYLYDRTYKESIKNGSLKYLGIYANQLKFDQNDITTITNAYISAVCLCESLPDPKGIITETNF